MRIEKGDIIEGLKDKKVLCWSDLLEKLGMVERFKEYKEKTGELYDIKKVSLGATMIEWVDSILKARIAKSKDKRVRGMKENWRMAQYGMDALHSCPETAAKDIDYLEFKGL